MKTKHESKNLLKTVINFIWYGGFTASIILVLAVMSYDLSVIGLINLRMPVISVKMNNHEYRFDSQYAEVKRIDTIVKEFVEMEIAKTYNSQNPFFVDAIEQLYKIDFNKIPQLPKEALPYARIGFSPPPPLDLLPIRYFEHRLTPELIIGFSFLVVFVAVLFNIILSNLRKIFNNSVTDGAFSSENSELLKYIGFYFLIGEFVRVLIFYWINNAVARREWVNAVRQSYGFNLGDINFVLIFAGVIFLILAQIFRVGAILKQENDLTV